MKVGDTVVRMLAGVIEMPLEITALPPGRIVCGAWEFDAPTGAEIDEDLGWGPNLTGSFLRRKASGEFEIKEVSANKEN